MAANKKAVRQRIRSIENTMQITKAMELVAASKLRRAKDRAERAKPYYSVLYDALAGIAAGNTEFASVFAKESKVGVWCYVMISGDRGFAGGYNNNVFRTLAADSAGKEFVILPIGKKSVEYCERRGIPMITKEFEMAGSLGVSDCFEAARLLCEGFRQRQYGHISLLYTQFNNLLSQENRVDSILPLTDLRLPEGKVDPVLYEPNGTEVFDIIVPEYLAGLIYAAMSESVASEQATRRMVMDAATKNAGEMIDQLNLLYNRIRQTGITQEITEIVGGAEGS